MQILPKQLGMSHYVAKNRLTICANKKNLHPTLAPYRKVVEILKPVPILCRYETCWMCTYYENRASNIKKMKKNLYIFGIEIQQASFLYGTAGLMQFRREFSTKLRRR